MTSRVQRRTFLDYKGYRYLKGAGLLTGAAALVYWLSKPPGGQSYGGTWFGYVLGVVSALLVLVLAWYGLRKRHPPKVQDRRRGNRRQMSDTTETESSSRRARDRRKRPAEDSWRYGGTLQGWLSAHAYFGIALIVLSSLHAGFRFGWNVHTLAYALVVFVVVSGFYGMYSYLHHPRQITENLGEDSLGKLLLKISELDELARMRALGLPDEINALVTAARQGTQIGGSLSQQLSGRQRNCPTDLAVHRVQELAKELVSGDQPRLIRDLYSVLLQKQRLVVRARNDVSLNARMQFWLYLHVPFSIALLAALFVHIASVLVYW